MSESRGSRAKERQRPPGLFGSDYSRPPSAINLSPPTPRSDAGGGGPFGGSLTGDVPSSSTAAMQPQQPPLVPSTPNLAAHSQQLCDELERQLRAIGYTTEWVGSASSAAASPFITPAASRTQSPAARSAPRFPASGNGGGGGNASGDVSPARSLTPQKTSGKSGNVSVRVRHAGSAFYADYDAAAHFYFGVVEPSGKSKQVASQQEEEQAILFGVLENPKNLQLPPAERSAKQRQLLQMRQLYMRAADLDDVFGDVASLRLGSEHRALMRSGSAVAAFLPHVVPYATAERNYCFLSDAPFDAAPRSKARAAPKSAADFAIGDTSSSDESDDDDGPWPRFVAPLFYLTASPSGAVRAEVRRAELPLSAAALARHPALHAHRREAFDAPHAASARQHARDCRDAQLELRVLREDIARVLAAHEAERLRAWRRADDLQRQLEAGHATLLQLQQHIAAAAKQQQQLVASKYSSDAAPSPLRKYFDLSGDPFNDTLLPQLASPSSPSGARRLQKARATPRSPPADSAAHVGVRPSAFRLF